MAVGNTQPALAQVRRVRSSGRAWTVAEKSQTQEIIRACQARGMTLTEAFKEVSRALPHRSPAAVAMLYYNVLRRREPHPTTGDAAPTPAAGNGSRNPASGPAPSRSPQPFIFDPEVIEAFEGLPEYIARIHHRLDQVEAQLAANRLPMVQPDQLAAWLREWAERMDAWARLEAELAGTRDHLAQAQAEQATLRARLQASDRRIAELQQAYNEARDLYELFTNMASISQIMSLGDFKQRLKTTLDRWGTVVTAELEPAPQPVRVQPPGPAPG